MESLEQFLHKAYLGQKRFSIEGVDMLVPMLDFTMDIAAEAGAREVVIGMAHRGRLNVLAHTVGRPPETIFAEFEGGRQVEAGKLTPEDGTGDVKYHHGAEGTYQAEDGRTLAVALVAQSQPPRVRGPRGGRPRPRATDRPARARAGRDPTAALPVVIHGDAAFAGQGVVAETLNLGSLAGYDTGGTMHLITNNQIGFTTDPDEARSTRYASDLAKGFDIPIVHVNGDDAEACLSAVRLSMAYRQKFNRDALIDLVGYRRHGHNEGDEPAYTQPAMYQIIKAHPTVRQRYAEQLAAEGVVTAAEAEAQAARPLPAARRHPAGVQGELEPRTRRASDDAGGRPGQRAGHRAPRRVPDGAQRGAAHLARGLHGPSEAQKQLERRRAALGPEGGIDWAQAEALAFASLLVEGVPIRLTGQDTERGTFSQRHLVLHDAETGASYAPHPAPARRAGAVRAVQQPALRAGHARLRVRLQRGAPEALVLWEAQFGDFINGAQVIIDQFLAAGLAKWG